MKLLQLTDDEYSTVIEALVGAALENHRTWRTLEAQRSDPDDTTPNWYRNQYKRFATVLTRVQGQK